MTITKGSIVAPPIRNLSLSFLFGRNQVIRQSLTLATQGVRLSVVGWQHQQISTTNHYVHITKKKFKHSISTYRLLNRIHCFYILLQFLEGIRTMILTVQVPQMLSNDLCEILPDLAYVGGIINEILYYSCAHGLSGR